MSKLIFRNSELEKVIILLLIISFSFTSHIFSQATIIFSEEFETIGSWFADNGLWEAGNATNGPTQAYSGQGVAATDLDGNYPGGANTRLISPGIVLPSISSADKIQLKFWHWFRFSDDNGRVQISVNGGEWITISDPLFDGTSTVWTQHVLDLSAYANSNIRIAFFFNSGTFNTDNGWYIDAVSIEKDVVIFNNPEDFELGIGCWSADNGLWEVGLPTAGPNTAHSGQMVAGTVLDGNYSGGANTRLISPEITLPNINSTEKIQLKFWHWFRFSDDNGRVQISANGGEWITISDPLFDGTSTVWTQHLLDLSAYADSTIRIAFYFNSGTFNVDNGWYIDDISIEKNEPTFCNPTDFELGIDNWSVDNGLWEVGIPTVGPESAHSGQFVAGTVLDGNYPGGANTRLISPEFTLTPIAGQSPTLFFWHWFRFSDDNGRVQVSVNGEAWEPLASPFDGTSTTWTQFGIDLSTYVNFTIRIAFYFTSGTFNTDNGWYIDDIRIEGIPNTDCLVGLNEICNDGIDNDNDGLIDCEDPDCSFVATISVDTGSNLCVNETISLLASPGNMTYNWAGPNVFPPNVQDPQIITATLTDSGTYSVTVTNSDGCTSSADAFITINSNPIATASNTGPYTLPAIGQLNASGGSSYVWDGPGEMNDSTLQNPTLPVLSPADAGTYTVTVTDINGCTDEASTIVEVTSSSSDVNIIIGENEGLQGSVIEIPIMITGCESLISAQWTLQLLEPGIASFVDIATAPDLNSTNAPQFNSDTGAFSFLSLSENGLQFADGDTVFVLSVLLTGAPGDMSDLTLSTNPLSIELGCLANGEPTTVDASVTNGKVSIRDVISVTGQVYAYNNVGMENVEVTLAGMAADGTSLDQSTNTDQNGNYIFTDVLAGSTFDIACTKFADYRNGLSTFELYIGQQYILGLSPSLISTAYQVVAGDANCTNSFTVADIVTVQRLLVGLIDDFSGPCPSWEFIPDSFTFPTNFTINNVFPYSTTAHFDAAVQDAVMNFRGIKKGDIIESANPQGLTELDERTAQSLFLEDQSIKAGEIFEIPFLLEDFKQLSGFQFSLHFDTDYLDFIEVISSLETQNPTLLVGNSRVQEGELLFSQIGFGVQMEEKNGRTELLRLRFQAKKDKASIKKLLSLTDQIATQVFNTDLELYPLNIQFSDQSLESIRVLNLQPNPTKQFTQLLIQSPEQMQIHATLFNTVGSEIKQWSFISQAGNNNFELSVDDLSAGTYFLKLSFGDHSEVKKLLIFH